MSDPLCIVIDGPGVVIINTGLFVRGLGVSGWVGIGSVIYVAHSFEISFTHSAVPCFGFRVLKLLCNGSEFNGLKDRWVRLMEIMFDTIHLHYINIYDDVPLRRRHTTRRTPFLLPYPSLWA